MGGDHPPRSRQEIRRWLVRRLADHLKWDEDRIDLSRSFAAFGLDSVTMVGISGELQLWLGRAVPPTVLYDAPNIDALSRALALEEDRSQPALNHTAAGHEPIAIVGMGCRLPGAGSPEDFWRLLANGVDAVGPVPSGRWQHIPAEIASTCGGFLAAVDRFDAPFFGIAPREAAYLDPQHRLLLEVTWEALEEAGLPADRLGGEPVGVFVGVSGNDYGRMIAAGPDLHDAYSVTGNSASMAANRISYHFDFRGPSLAIDTACSSSLIAVHLACEALRRGECQVAVAGGVNLLLTPDVSVTLTRAMMLSRSGRCRTFDAAADGYVRGEGCGVVVLKPLSSAIRDRDRVLALVLGSAVNQDGKSNGITAPSGQAQAALIRAALTDSGVSPEQVGYIESHGTGTVLGDPIEFSALKSALSAGSEPCAVSTVKTNLGHLESAAGIAGLLKAILQLRHGAIAPHLHLKQLNPHIALEGTRFYIPSELVAWPEGPAPRIAGVSSFGFGGSNAHVVLADAPPSVEPSEIRGRPRQLLTVSAHTEPALRELASEYHDFLIEDATAEVADVAFTASAGRSHRAHRLAIRGDGRADLAAGLEDFLAGQSSDRIHIGRASGERTAGIAFLFTGQGSQRPGMGRMLYECCPPFRDAIARCEGVLAALSARPVRSLFDPDDSEAHDRKTAAWAQPALFAIELALAETWRGWGIEPAAVMGHSLGEYVAACVAGVFTLEDALRLVVGRARLMDALPDRGAMAAVLAPIAKVEETLSALRNPVDVAAVNGPDQVVLSGDREVMRSVRDAFRRERIATHALDVSRAFHSREIEPILDELEQIATQAHFEPPRIPVISNLSGRPAGPEIQTAEYWRRHAREPVRFQAGVEWLKASGFEIFLEVGPAATLSSLGRSCSPGDAAEWLPSLRGGSDEWSDLLDALGRLYARGAAVDWRAFHAPFRRRLISMPTYPFEKSRHWVLVPQAQTPTVGIHEAETPANRPLNPERWVPRSRWEILAGRCAASSLGDLAQVALGLAENRRAARDDYQQGAARDPAGEDHQARRDEQREDFARNGAGKDHHANGDGYVRATARRAADQFVGAHIQRAFRDLGWAPSPGEPWTIERLGERLRIKPSFNRLLGRMLEILAEDGLLRRDGDRWEAGNAAWGDTEPDTVLHGLLERQPEHEAELTLADSCGRSLAAILRGNVDPLSILFPNGSPDLLTRIYGDAPLARVGNRLIAETIAGGLEGLPADRVVRIVEIGAGTGGTTSHVLSRLPQGRCEYLFTDVSSLFITHARERFREHRFVQYRPLDIERDPAQSGYAPHQFDIVLAANVLHATPDLRRSLAHVRQLLAPRGWLILLEGTGRERILDLIFGLTAGWWKYTDLDIRPDYPLISRESWLSLLEREGFTGCSSVAPTNESHQVIFLGRAPASVSNSPKGSGRLEGSWLIVADQPTIGAGLGQRLEAEGARFSLFDPASNGHTPSAISGTGACQCGHLQATACQCATDRNVVDLQLSSAVESMTAREIDRSDSRHWKVTRGRAGMDQGVPSHGRWVDLDPAASLDSCLDQLARELLSPDDDPFVAFRAGQRFVAGRESAVARAESVEHDTQSIEELRRADPPDRRRMIVEAVRTELARTLSLPVQRVELDRPMVSFGLDSLMAIQLKNRVEALANVSISLVKLLEGLSVAQLAAEIDESLSHDDSRPESANGTGLNGRHGAALGSLGNGATIEPEFHPADESVDGIDDLSEGELDVLIEDLLIGTNEHD
jgi:microcystin synthetase protein McyG